MGYYWVWGGGKKAKESKTIRHGIRDLKKDKGTGGEQAVERDLARLERIIQS